MKDSVESSYLAFVLKPFEFVPCDISVRQKQNPICNCSSQLNQVCTTKTTFKQTAMKNLKNELNEELKNDSEKKMAYNISQNFE